MPKHGLSLLGFMDSQAALNHLRTTCVTDPSVSDAELLKLHDAAIAKLGEPARNPGNPEVLDLPNEGIAHAQALAAAPWAKGILDSLPGWEVKLIELKPLLAYQFTVLTERSTQHTQALKKPVLSEMLPICLPLIEPLGEFKLSQVNQTTKSLLVKSADLNLNMRQWGLFPLQLNGAQIYFAGMYFQPRSPFMYVAKFNGRCYLANGYHRAYGLAKAGATHVPCLFREAHTHEEIG